MTFDILLEADMPKSFVIYAEWTITFVRPSLMPLFTDQESSPFQRAGTLSEVNFSQKL